ncbi:protein indeterminate-domain 16 [Malania oleifera]|uniref:protein indeterminate-domain 16 n=1 Tax=Malania oleifera TaxID=397392 RepID=UPI0025ADEA3C|nr:protein indeterminate-domain 16 [Malania oleifera]
MYIYILELQSSYSKLLPMEDEDQKELQLLPSTPQGLPSSCSSSSSSRGRPSDSLKYLSPADNQFEGPSLDLQLSISLRPLQSPPDCVLAGPIGEYGETGCLAALKWQAKEQIRLAAMEKAYAERVRELTRKEMELAQSEFARARHMWERAREEVERAERMRDQAIRRVDPTGMEITCQSCRQRFRP